MITPNAKLSELLALLATYEPAAVAASTVTTGWVPMAKVAALMAVLQTGVMGASGTIDAKLQQATDAAGTGAKDVTGKAIVQLVKATGDAKQVLINLKPEELDVANGFAFVRLSITVGTAASLLGAQIWGAYPRDTLSLGNQAGLVQAI